MAIAAEYTMRAAVIDGPGRVVVKSVPRVAPKAGEVRVRIWGCGLCASNLPCFVGRPSISYPMAPGSPGHEAWGIVDAVGEGVTDVDPGTPVAAISHNAFAEYDIAPAAGVVPLGPSFAKEDFPGEALGCAVNVFRRARVQPGEQVVVVGVGFLGALVVQLCVRAGAQVIAVSRRESSRQLARSFGASHTLSLADPASTRDTVMQLTSGVGASCVFEVAGVQATLALAGQLVAVPGRLVIAGYHQDGLRQVDLQYWSWRGLDVVNAHERELDVHVRGVREAMSAIKEGGIDPRPLYTHHFTLDTLDRAYATLSERPHGFVKALVSCV